MADIDLMRHFFDFFYFIGVHPRLSAANVFVDS